MASVLGLQRSAGNRAVTSLVGQPGEQDASAERDADRVADRLVSTWQTEGADVASERLSAGSSEPGELSLPPSLRAGAERVLGASLGAVRLHANTDAADTADSFDANALAVGHDIFFSRGRFTPESAAGRTLLGHELAHVAQQASTGIAAPQAQPKEKDPKPKKVLRATIFKDIGVVVFELEDDTTKSGTIRFKDAVMPPGTYIGRRVEGRLVLFAEGGTPEPVPGKFTYTIPRSITFDGVESYKARVIAGNPATTGASKLSGGMSDPAAATIETGVSAAKPSPDTPRELTEAEKRVWKELVETMRGGTQKDDTPALEQLRLFQVLRDMVEDPQFGGKGEPWTKFAKFLELNKDRIEGILQGKPPGELTQEKIEKIIAEYGKFISSEPLEQKKDDGEKEGGLETVEDFNKEFKYDPAWQKLSKKDRQLLVEMAKLDPDSVSDQPVDFREITSTMKVMMALKLSWKSWPGETADAAKNAFTDPTFLITLLVMMGIYVGLWLTPDPTWITKIAAGTLTAVLLAQFALEDIIGFAMAWSQMSDECAYATTAAQLKAAGDKFAKKVGQVGFDIILMIVMHRLGKAAGPKFKAKFKVVERNVASAKAAVEVAEAKPGSGTNMKPTPEHAKLLDNAKSNAKGTTPTAVLDALAELLPESAKKGLAALRNKAGDAGAWRSMEARVKADVDLVRHLTELGMSEQATAKAKLDLLNAEAKLARAELIEAETYKDPALREAARTELVNKLKSRLSALGIFDDPNVKKAASGGELKDLVGALGEAIQRTQLKAEFGGTMGGRIVSRLAVARRIAGFKTIAEWKTAEVAAGRPGETARLIQYQGEVFRLVGEADAVVMQETSPGQYRPIAVEEVKGGAADSPTKAKAQVTKLTGALTELSGGSTELRVFELKDSHTVGSDWTWQLDLSAVDSITNRTRGPEGKGFDTSLGYDAEVLLELAKSIAKDGLPPKNPTKTLPPLARPSEEKKEPVPAGR